MGQTANIFDAARLNRPPVPILPAPREDIVTLASARLIPGAGNLFPATAKKNPQSVLRAGRWASPTRTALSGAKGAGVSLVPQFFQQFHPSMLGVALLDVTVISVVFALESVLESTAHRSTLLAPMLAGSLVAPNSATLVFFMAAFLLFAIQEGLYSNCRRTLRLERRVAAKAILWTSLLTSAASISLSPKPDLLYLLLLGGASAFALCGLRRISQAVPGVGVERNVLIVGSGGAGQRAARAIQENYSFGCCVKGVLPEHYLQELNGAARLRSLAREECIDEVIVATYDSEVAAAAIREARRNQLDVRVVPELFGSEPEVLELENLAGVPLVKIHKQPLPEWTLAMKRITDVILAAAGLVGIVPLLLIIAVVIRLDSPGPVLYRGPRVGRKKRTFTCYKFRTMVPAADAAKADLRVRNEREGAFFKISNDPRLTRAGCFLRRYSLDELPQLWNVLRGEMSLVGPRPHPPDDVERYQVEHLQRLDFVPGMTGLWQVTARRDRSFERSVSLDVEYIQTWSLALDLRILLKTIPAVFQGSGA